MLFLFPIVFSSLCILVVADDEMLRSMFWLLDSGFLSAVPWLADKLLRKEVGDRVLRDALNFPFAIVHDRADRKSGSASWEGQSIQYTQSLLVDAFTFDTAAPIKLVWV